jgi:c-di-GMP-binding flagellar brake protein YcgR
MDKRSCRRLPVRVGCWLVEIDELVCVYTFDISAEGVCVVGDEPLPAGKVVNLQFFTPRSAQPVQIEAEVVWSREEGGAYALGLRFLAGSQAACQTVREFTEYLHRQRRGQSLA